MNTGGRLFNIVGWIWVLGLIAFLILPVLIVVPASFADVEQLVFPPEGLSFRWYEQLFSDRRWQASALLSAKIALGATFVAVPVALLAAMARVRFATLSGRQRMYLLLPLVVPHSVVATGLFTILLKLGILESQTVLAITHAAFALPLALLLLIGALEAIDPLIWSAAATLGARPDQVLTRVIFPIIWPALMAASLLVFIFSWDEVVATVFIGPVAPAPLPALMFTYLQETVTPVIAAVASLLLLISIVLGGLVLVLNRSSVNPSVNWGQRPGVK